jgi:hypothetical protein
MCTGLTRNICKLSSPDTVIDTIQRSHIDDVLPEELQYACRFWVHHLYRGRNKFLIDEDLQDRVYYFLRGYFVFWLEALSLLQLIHVGISSLEVLESLVNDVSVITEPGQGYNLC